MNYQEAIAILDRILLRSEKRKVNKLIPDDILDIKTIIKQLSICDVGCSICPCGKVTSTKDCHCPDSYFFDDDLH